MARPTTRKTNAAKAPVANEAAQPDTLVKKVRGKVAAAASEIKTKVETAKTQAKKLASKKRKVSGDNEDDFNGHESCAEKDNQTEDDERPVKKRKTKAKAKAEDDMKITPRTAVASLQKAMYIGAHVSAAGGLSNAFKNSNRIGANALALFLKNQRQWNAKPLEPDAATEFRDFAKKYTIDQSAHVLPHGSYLVNLAQPDVDKAKQAYTSFVDDLQRCETLGIRLYNFHPGSTLGHPSEEAITRVIEALNRAHAATKTVITVLENMAGGGNTLGSRFEDLAAVIAGVKDKTRVGVCLDTCHAFAAGYDLRSPEAFITTMEEFDRVVGLKYLRALHLNDSRDPLASNRDRHANIGAGFLGLRAFHNVVNYAPFAGLPMVLETPIDKKKHPGDKKAVEDVQIWADEIKLLESLIGFDAESEEFAKLEKELLAKGDGDRAAAQAAADKKADKQAKTATKAAKGGKRASKEKKVETSDEEDSD